MQYCCVMILFHACLQVKEIDLITIKAQYDTAYIKAKTAYSNIDIQESRLTLTEERPICTRRGSICGDYIAASYRYGTEQNEHYYLSPRGQLTMNYNEMSKSWVYRSYAIPSDRVALDAWKSNLIDRFPEAFRLPFETYVYNISINDIFKGVTKPIKNVIVLHPIIISKIERVISCNRLGYRLNFVVESDPGGKVFVNYVDIVPELSWMITKGHYRSWEWENEYGEKVNDVHVIKSHVFKQVMENAKTGQTEMVPIYRSMIDKAISLTTVNPEEYEPAYYGIEIPEINENRVPVTVLSIGAAGTVSFMIGILLVMRAQRSSRLTSNKQTFPVDPVN